LIGRERTLPRKNRELCAQFAGCSVFAGVGRTAMMEIRVLGPQIGAEVTGVDIRTLDGAGFAPIYQAWLDYNIVCVRDQDLTIPEFVAYSRRFGPVVPHPSKSTRHAEHPEITMLGVGKFDEQGNLRNEIYRRGAEGWHTDGAYNQAPFKATQLYALAVPSRGGDTLFASGYAAYDALPERLKQRLDGVIGAFAYAGRRGKSKLLDPEDQNWPPVYHAIVRIHPETGRRSLYFDPGKIVDFVGVERAEGDALIAELKERMILPEAEYHHKWRKGDIVIWDNRCSYHKAAGDYPPEEDRIHWRVSINDFGVEALDETAE
jgi:taurine dioxygenase